MPPGISLERSQAMGRPGYWDLQCGPPEGGHCEGKVEPRSKRVDTSGPLSVSTTSSVSTMRGRASRSKSTGMGTRARADVQSPTLSFRSLLEDAMNTSRVQPGELSLRGYSLPPVSYFSLLRAQLGDARVEGRVTSCKAAVETRSKLPLSPADVKGGFMALLNETTRSLSPVAQRPCPPSGVHSPNKFSQAFAEKDTRAADIVSKRDSDDSLRPTASAEGDVPRAESAHQPSSPSVDMVAQAFAEDESRSADRDIGDSPGATASTAVEGDVPRAQRPSSPSVDSGAHCLSNISQASAKDDTRSAERDSEDLLGATALAMVERSEGDVPRAEFAQQPGLPSVAHRPNQLLQASAEDESRSAVTVSERDSNDLLRAAAVEGSEGDVEVEQRSSLVADSMCSDENALEDQFPEEDGGLLTARSVDTLSDILETTYPSSPVLTRIKEDVSLVEVMALTNETSRFRATDAQRPCSPSFDSGAQCPHHLSQAFAEDESRDSDDSLGATALAAVEGDVPLADFVQRPCSPAVDSGAHCPDNLLQVSGEVESRSADKDSDDLLGATGLAMVERSESDIPRAELAQRLNSPSNSSVAQCPHHLSQAFAEDESRSAERDSDDSLGATVLAAVEGCEGDVPRAESAQRPSSPSVDSGAHCPDNLLQASAEDESRSADMVLEGDSDATASAAAEGNGGNVPGAEDLVDQRSSLMADLKCSDERASVDQFPEAHELRSADTLSDAIDILETSSPVLTRIKEDVPQADVMLADSAFIVDEILDALLFEELLRGLGMDETYASDIDPIDSPSLLEEEVVADEVVDVERIQSPVQQPLETEHLPNGEPTKEMGDAGSANLEWACEGGLTVMMDANGSIIAEKSCEVQRCYVLDSVFEIYEPSTPDIVDTEELQNAKKRKDDSHLPAEIKKHRISYQNSTPQRLHPPELCTKLQSKILRRD